jgi:hypothetical protein
VPFRLVPPLRDPVGAVSPRIRFVPCSVRFTGRPRPIPGEGFYAWRDKIYRRDVLWRAWVTVYRNGGAPGIDG